MAMDALAPGRTAGRTRLATTDRFFTRIRVRETTPEPYLYSRRIFEAVLSDPARRLPTGTARGRDRTHARPSPQWPAGRALHEGVPPDAVRVSVERRGDS